MRSILILKLKLQILGLRSETYTFYSILKIKVNSFFNKLKDQKFFKLIELIKYT